LLLKSWLLLLLLLWGVTFELPEMITDKEAAAAAAEWLLPVNEDEADKDGPEY
jgi:hypothetical protein